MYNLKTLDKTILYISLPGLNHLTESKWLWWWLQALTWWLHFGPVPPPPDPKWCSQTPLLTNSWAPKSMAPMAAHIIRTLLFRVAWPTMGWGVSIWTPLAWQKVIPIRVYILSLGTQTPDCLPPGLQLSGGKRGAPQASPTETKCNFQKVCNLLYKYLSWSDIFHALHTAHIKS